MGQEWRFPNVPKKLYPQVETAVALLKKDLDEANPKNWKKMYEAYEHGVNLYDAVYAYGFPMTLVCKAIRISAYGKIPRAEARLRKRSKYAKFGDVSFFSYSDGILLDDLAFAETFLSLHERIRAADYALTGVIIEAERYVETALMENRIDDQALDYARRWTELGGSHGITAEYPFLVNKNSKGFNELCKKNGEASLGGSEARRLKKRSQLPHDMVDFTITASMALALHLGMKISYCDAGCPIWDFPIAQRPEIQKLLSPDIRKRIPPSLD